MASGRSSAHQFLNFPRESCHSSQRQQIWSHFVNTTSRVVTLPFEGDDDPIMSQIISNGLHDTMVANSVLCLGASHLINGSTPGSPKVESLMQSKESLLRKVREDLSVRVTTFNAPRQNDSSDRTEHDAILASFMLLYLYEISEGTGISSRLAVLNQARSFVYAMLNTHDHDDGKSEMEANSQAFEFSHHCLEHSRVDNSLLQFFAYHDILGRILNYDDGTNQDPTTDRIPLQALNAGYLHQDLILQMHHGLMDIILHVHILQSEASAAKTPGGEVIARAVQIWQTVSDWDTPESAFELSDLYEAYIAAISIWLLLIIYSDNKRSDKIQSMVMRGLIVLAEMDSSDLQATSIFPFYFIGLGCTSLSDRNVLLGELTRLENVQRLGYIQEFREILRDRWHKYDEESDQLTL